MGKNINHIQHVKSNVVLEGKPKLPESGVLVEGELAVNYSDGYETISLENTNNEIVTFSSDEYYTKQKLGSGFTGDNSAKTVTDVIVENEEIISASLNDLNERKLDASAFTVHTADTTIHLTSGDIQTQIEDSALWVSGSGTNAVALKGGSNTASGNYSVAEGYLTKAEGNQSHTEGYATSGTGYQAHAEGLNTLASGNQSHAEGTGSIASDNYSHAEGNNTKASGQSSHAEGEYTIAKDLASHAEGYYTSATTYYSHAEGLRTRANGGQSHAEGDSTIAGGLSSHAEGYNTKADGNQAHAEGTNTTASGNSSHAEGNYSQATGNYGSHAEGNNTKASGASSHAEGNSTVAGGNYSHAEGSQTLASGNYSHAEGEFTSATTFSAHAEGANTLASGQYSHAEGSSTKANGMSSHAEGDNTTASGQYSHAEGFATKANGDYSHAEGFATKANNNSEHASGQYNVSSSASTTFGNSGNTLFSVGNGTADNARHNAFEIRQNGDIYIVNKEGNDVKLQDEIGNITIDQVIDSSTSASTDAVSTSAVYGFVTSYTPSITVDQVLDDTTSASTNPVSSKAVYDAVTDNELVWTNAYVTLSGVVSSITEDLSTNYYTKDETSGKTEISTALGTKVNSATYTGHTADTSVHFSGNEKANLDSLATNIATISGITSTKVSNWDSTAANSHNHTNKTYLDGITGAVGTMVYQNASSYSSATQVDTALGDKADKVSAFTDAEYNSTDKKIYFKNSNGTVVDNIDTTDFIKDGMVNNVEVKSVAGSGTCLVISFNTDAGKEDINIPISDMFNASNYYQKSETSGATELSTEFSLYYKKTETSGSTELTNAFNEKVNVADVVSAITSANSASTNPVSVKVVAENELVVSSALNDLNVAISGVNGTLSAHTADTSIHLTSTEKTNLDSLATNIAAISGVSSSKVSNWDTAYANNHTHSNKAKLDAITGDVGTMAYQNANSYSSATQVNTALAGKSDTGHTHDGTYAKNAFSRITVGSTNVDADTTGDTFIISGGTFVTLTPDATADKMTIGVSTGTSSTTLARGDHSHDYSGTYAAKSHNHEASAVTAFTDYQIASSSASVLTTDSLLQVIGKLEKRIQLLESSMGGLKLVKISQTDYDNLGTKDSNTLYVIV